MENTEIFSTELLDNTESVLNETDSGSELIDSTELADNLGPELRAEGVSVPESSDISAEELSALLNGTLNDYFEQNTIQVVVDSGAGVHKSLDELTLTEVCLVIIVLILIGRSILQIIGGRAWNK